ncbi:MAG: tRNA pseudouridine(13) synthase TruD [Trueperaceae bacterium]
MTDDLRHKLMFRWADFTPVTFALPGTGGVLRSVPEDFRVEELPLYLPQGHGSYAYALVEKRNLTTRDLMLALLREGLREGEIGVAGLKDKVAVTQQWLSVPNRHAGAFAALEKLEHVRILETSRHQNRLGMGHLKGNRFTIRVRQTEDNVLQKARAILEVLQRVGVPNYFGPQRFGINGVNAVDGYRLVHREAVPVGYHLKGFFISSLQSLVVNHLLARRIERQMFDAVILGDWAKKHDTGGVFKVETDAEAERAKRFEISATLPLFGKKVKVSEAKAGEMEQEVLNYLELSWVKFAIRRGDRRYSRLPLGEVGLEATEDGYIIRFDLSRGAFATSLLRELLKTDVDEHNDVQDENPKSG